MSASFLPSIFVPLIGLVAPLITITYFFAYVGREQIVQ